MCIRDSISLRPLHRPLCFHSNLSIFLPAFPSPIPQPFHIDLFFLFHQIFHLLIPPFTSFPSTCSHLFYSAYPSGFFTNCLFKSLPLLFHFPNFCLLYTSDAAD